MAVAMNVVRFRVKPGREQEFVEVHRQMKEPFPGMRRAWLIKTGEHTFCLVALWEEFKKLSDARPLMIANLDKVRDCLEDVGNGLGVTDPVSGEVLVQIGAEAGGGTGGKGDKAERAARKKAKRAQREAKKNKGGAAAAGGGGGKAGKGKGKKAKGKGKKGKGAAAAPDGDED